MHSLSNPTSFSWSKMPLRLHVRRQLASSLRKWYMHTCFTISPTISFSITVNINNSSRINILWSKSKRCSSCTKLSQQLLLRCDCSSSVTERNINSRTCIPYKISFTISVKVCYESRIGIIVTPCLIPYHCSG